MKPCIVIPIFEHADTIGGVVAELKDVGLPCLIVDDGSGSHTQRILAQLVAAYDFVEVLRRPENGGKGAALKTGYRAARARGFSHVVQIDADGQHDPRDAACFLEALRARPDALVLGVPVFDESVPLSRLYARQLSRGLVWLACLSRVVPDPLCGYRGIPLGPTLAVLDAVRTGDRMDFDPDLVVRLVWEGVPIVPLRTRVRYIPGVRSHFSFARDYPLLAALYTRLIAGRLVRGLAPARSRRTAGRP